MAIKTVAIMYSGQLLGFGHEEIEGTENIFGGYIHIFVVKQQEVIYEK